MTPAEFVLLTFPVNDIEDPDIGDNGWHADKPIDKVLLLYANGVESCVIFETI